jgi:hypothetical protein
VALHELDIVRAGRGRVAAREGQHLLGHVQPDDAPAWPDPAGGDEHVRARARAEVQHRLALVQVGDGGRDAAAERGLDRAGGHRRLLRAVQRVAEHLLGRRVGERRRVRPAGTAGGVARRRSAGGRRVLVPHALADLGSDQLSHSRNASSPVGRRK